MRIFRLLRKHLLFTRRERLAFITLNLLLISSMIFHIWAHYFDPPQFYPPPRQVAHKAMLPEEQEPQQDFTSFSFTPFDPNTVTQNELLAFGISQKAADNLIKYRNAGGSLQEAEDIFKLYSWTEEEKQAALPYIAIAGKASAYKDHAVVPANAEVPQSVLFEFNPNTAKREDWISLGVPAYLADRIGRYLEAGGNFTSAEDVKKIYGFREADFERLQPYMQFPQREVSVKKEEEEKTNYHELPTVATGAIPVNTTNAEALTACGLSSTAAWKVINYRDKLGGFYSAEQLTEIKGLEKEVLGQLLACVLIDTGSIKKLRINKADFTDLANHPYLSDKLARAIVQYRDSTGYYRSVDEITRAYRISPAYLKKLKNYLSL
jgi:competence protein ComEA